MTLDQLFSRVFRAHLVLIVIITLVPVAAVVALGLTSTPQYRASTRIQATSAVPSSSTEADGLSSRVLAIATTPGVVRDALKAVDQKGDPLAIAENHITAQRLGESPIVELSVTGASKSHAGALVKELSTQVITFMNTADRGRFETAVEDVNRRLADVRTQQDRLFEQLKVTPPGDARNRLRDLASEASQVAQELSSQRASLIMADVTRGRAVLVEKTGPTVLREPSGLLPRVGLALVLGLSLAIATSAGIETMRPKVPNARGLARELDTPLLATTQQSSESLASTLSLVARRNGLDTVVIMAADPRRRAEASALAEVLSRARHGHDRLLDPVLSNGRPHAGIDGEAPYTTDFVDLASLDPAHEVTAGVAVVCGGSASHAQVEVLRDVIQATRWPLVGVLDAGEDWGHEGHETWHAGSVMA